MASHVSDLRDFPHSVASIGAAKGRLRQLADDCDARARRSGSPDARARYHRAASDARRDASSRYMGVAGLRMALAAVAAQMRFAAWCDGAIDEYDAAQERGEVAGDRQIKVPVASLESIGMSKREAGQILSARELAELAGMSERGALKRIVHSFCRGLPGFYRVGRLWFAEREAFDQFRMSSERAAHVIFTP